MPLSTVEVSGPVVTIITPSYNQGRFIRATIESILAQDYPNIEYLVVDGGSTDHTISILREFGERVRWISERDRGQTHAINKGLAMTVGEIITWVNSDDVLEPGAISAAVAAFQEDPRTALVYGNARELNAEGQHIRDNYPPAPNVWELVHGWDYIIQPASFFRRNKMEEVGGLDEELHWAMDYDLFMRLALNYPIKRVDAFLASYRFYDECKSCAGGWKRYMEIVRVLRRYNTTHTAPAFFLYAWELVNTTLTRLNNRARPLLRKATHHPTQKLRRRAELFLYPRITRWYFDGWVAPIFEWYLLNEGKEMIELHGHIPPEKCLGDIQRLRFIVDGILVREMIIGCGDFSIAVPIPKTRGPMIHLRVEAKRSFIPSRFYKGGGDNRRIAYHLKHIGGASPKTCNEPQWSTGCFADGWAGPQVSSLLQTNEAAVEITGCIPDGYPKLQGQTLRLTIDGKVHRDIMLKEGSFREVLTVPARGKPFELCLNASHWFVPAYEEKTDDYRRLAFRLDGIRCISA